MKAVPGEAALIEQIYEATIEKDPWASFLHDFRCCMNSTSALMMFRLPSKDSQAVNIDDSEWHFQVTKHLYYEKYCTLNPFDYERMEPGRIYSLHDFADEEAFKSSTYYREFCQQLQVEHALAVYLGNVNGLRAWLNIARDEGKGDYTSAEVGLFEQLLPHLERAFRIFSQLEQYRSESSIYSHTIDNMHIAALLVDNTGVVSGMNELAKGMLSAEAGIEVADGRLRFSNSVDNKQYDYFINKLINDEHETDYEAMTVDAAGNHVSILMRRIKALTKREFANSTSVIIYMKKVGNKSFAATQIISSLFGLTRTEARMAVMLANGQDLEQIALGLGVTEQTARTYCKRVFAKTGTRRQAELVRLILTSLANLAT